MPPSFGYRADNSATARPCGTKNSNAARSHSVRDDGPELAAVLSQRRLSTATRLKSTRSRSDIVRLSTGACASVTSETVYGGLACDAADLVLDLSVALR